MSSEAEAAPGRAAKLLGGLRDRSRPYWPALCASSLLGAICIYAILDRVGRPAMPLDDSFIHLQYARRLTEGGFMSFVPGRGYTSGATSFLWPILLAPFYAVGFRGLALVVATWILGTLAHAAVATETARVTEPLAGRAGAVGAGAMCLAFGAFAWFAWSGMETVVLAWALMRSIRLSSTWMENGEVSRRALLVMAFVAPLTRPEGMIASGLIAFALAWHPRRSPTPKEPLGKLRSRAPAAIALAGALVVPAVHWLATGQARSSTTSVKWLVGNPYYPWSTLIASVQANVELLVTDILDGGRWSVIFIPEGLAYALLAGVIALGFAATRNRLGWRALFVMAIVLATMVPCTYLSFLWNRVRYVWPFAGAWFVLLACLASELGRLARRFQPRWTFVTPGIAGLFVGALAMKLPWSVRDLAQSAHAIDRQQVALGEWAREALDPDALIGVNDTGAIAYMSGRATFDVVGLTTRGEAPYWVAGPGSRFEHYERLGEGQLPTHFVVYDAWMAMPVVLGERLHDATVTDQSILGGATKTAYVASWDALGSGQLPTTLEPEGELVDELDVSDLESEAAHRYVLGQTTDRDNQVGVTFALDGTERPLADGGRYARTHDRFVVELNEGRRATLVARLASAQPIEVEVFAGGKPAGSLQGPAGAWQELTLEIPGELIGRWTSIRLEARGEHPEFAALHYWFYQ